MPRGAGKAENAQALPGVFALEQHQVLGENIDVFQRYCVAVRHHFVGTRQVGCCRVERHEPKVAPRVIDQHKELPVAMVQRHLNARRARQHWLQGGGRVVRIQQPQLRSVFAV